MPIIANQLKVFTYNNVFVETGTSNGLGVLAAIEAGFKQIYSIEFYENKYLRAIDKFKDFDYVHIVQGDSGKVLSGLLNKIAEPITFWLDAHYSKGKEYPKPLIDKCPILLELEQIKRHHIFRHTILIDDIRIFKQGIGLWNNIKLEQIIKKLKEINNEYSISYMNGHIANDILIATCIAEKKRR